MANLIVRNYKLLLATRHLTRQGDTESIQRSDLELAKTMKLNLEAVAGDFHLNSEALVSGYKTLDGNFGRTQNTAHAFGYALFMKEEDLMFTPDKDWESIPFGKNFAEFRDAYNMAEDGGVRKIVDTHANLYQRIFSEITNGNGRHAFTHDSRIEAACAKLVPQYAERLGAPMDYGETLALVTKDNKVYQPLAIVRRYGIQDV